MGTLTEDVQKILARERAVKDAPTAYEVMRLEAQVLVEKGVVKTIEQGVVAVMKARPELRERHAQEKAEGREYRYPVREVVAKAVPGLESASLAELRRRAARFVEEGQAKTPEQGMVLAVRMWPDLYRAYRADLQGPYSPPGVRRPGDLPGEVTRT